VSQNRRRLESTNLNVPASEVQNNTRTSSGACKYCLEETGLLQYLQGVYDGQKILDASMNDTNVKTCI
jgi:hypothetical protein